MRRRHRSRTTAAEKFIVLSSVVEIHGAENLFQVTWLVLGEWITNQITENLRKNYNLSQKKSKSKTVSIY